MESLDSKKKEFILCLTTLGELLAVFLGFVVGATSFFSGYVLGFGLLFAVSALFSYSSIQFKDNIESRVVREISSFSYVLLAMSFGFLVAIGVGQLLSLIPGEYPTALVYEGATLAIAGSMLGTMTVVLSVLRIGSRQRELPFYAR